MQPFWEKFQKLYSPYSTIFVAILECIGPLTGGTTKDDALAQSNATFSLLLPGDVLDLTA